jgi:hypothetical protein
MRNHTSHCGIVSAAVPGFECLMPVALRQPNVSPEAAIFSQQAIERRARVAIGVIFS